jgi:hypothetical protein
MFYLSASPRRWIFALLFAGMLTLAAFGVWQEVSLAQSDQESFNFLPLIFKQEPNATIPPLPVN